MHQLCCFKMDFLVQIILVKMEEFVKLNLKIPDINVTDSEQNSLLHTACKEYNLNLVDMLFKTQIDPFLRNKQNRLALQYLQWFPVSFNTTQLLRSELKLLHYMFKFDFHKYTTLDYNMLRSIRI
mmetsp:Transcript_23888/g.53070  ORF Transcript_23888/g.53070 Transcript_23888/m.53070 type:complete len:125 (+) Transcript_23888:125-499(+)